MASFTELETWKQARKTRIFISKLTNQFPVEEKYRLVDQIIRCSRFVGNNIAEGHGRFHYQDNVRFCVIAGGSWSETLDQMLVAREENDLNDETLTIFRLE